MQDLVTKIQKTCFKCETSYNTEKYQFCPRCQQENDFNNEPWKEN